jgi:hypothetical protein
MSPTDTLRLIEGGAQKGEFGTLTVAPQPLPQLTRRPGDHLELHSFTSGEALAPIRVAARKRGLDSETALALVIERSLLVAEVATSAGSAMVEELDRQSTISQVHINLWSAHGSYLQHLLGHRAVPASARPLDSPRVALPIRLLDRIRDENLDLQDDPDRQLAVAVNWEIAALLASETISEWAYRTLALQLLR